jgi:pilus assembly protein CpaB
MRHRTGLLLVLAGFLLAGVTTLLVIRIANQAVEASRGTIRQVNVVTANREILDQMLIPMDALTIKAFPADFVPIGAIGSPEQVVGKFARGHIAKDQVLVTQQLATIQASPNLSDRVPPGKVAVWLPMPELLANANVMKPGDRVDLLLTVKFEQVGDDKNKITGTWSGLSTQTTLQNVEVFRLGQEELNSVAIGDTTGQYARTTLQSPPAAAQGGQSSQGNNASNVGSQPTRSGQQRPIGFLVDHQDAVMIKYIKDSGGTIDIVTRSTEEQQIVRTDAVTQDMLTERFRFRVPQPVVAPLDPVPAPR